MTAHVIPFPQRRTEAGGLHEPWVAETALARHFGGVDPRTIRRWRAQGMPSRLRGGRRLYKITHCERWHDERGSAHVG